MAIVRFASALRAAGLHADLDATIAFARALPFIDLASPDDVRAAGAAVFVDRPDELVVYNAVFDSFWYGAGTAEPNVSHRHADGTQVGRSIPAEGHRPVTETISGADGGEVARPPADSRDGKRITTATAMTYSSAEVLRSKSFEDMTAEERRDAMRMIDQLEPLFERRRTRRYRLHSSGPILAPRWMMRRSLSTAGDPLTWLWRRRRTHPRPVVTICDVSGSMELHSRFALRFVHALTHTGVLTESFAFGTRLTRITPHLRNRDADVAMRELTPSVQDWDGGTQLGEALRVFNRQWARRVLRSSAIVIVVSDGWDRGDPQLVGEEMALLSRRCQRLVWLNPLAETKGYEPKTAGMAAAYPFVDDFLAIASVANLEHVARLLGRAPRRSSRTTNASARGATRFAAADPTN